MDRIAEQLRQELSQLMVGGMKDERIHLATVSSVVPSPDLRSARVMVSAIGDDRQRRDVLVGLRHAEGYLRGELGHRLENLRTIPHLRFELDESIEYSVRIGSVLKDIEPAGGWTGEEGAAPTGKETP